jgi:hypothetical protein
VHRVEAGVRWCLLYEQILASSGAGYIDESGGLNLAPAKADTQVWDEHTHLITIAEQP